MFDLRKNKVHPFTKLTNYLPIFLLVVPIYSFEHRALSYVRSLQIIGTILLLIRITSFINYTYGIISGFYEDSMFNHSIVEYILFTLFLIIQIKSLIDVCFLQLQNWESMYRYIQEIDDVIGNTFEEKLEKYIFYNFISSLTIVLISVASMTYWTFNLTVYENTMYIFSNTTHIFMSNVAFTVSIFSLAIYRRFQVFNRLIIEWYKKKSSSSKQNQIFLFAQMVSSEYFPFLRKLWTLLSCTVDMYNQIFGVVILVLMGNSLWALVYGCSFLLANVGDGDVVPSIFVLYITSEILVSFVWFIKNVM